MGYGWTFGDDHSTLNTRLFNFKFSCGLVWFPLFFLLCQRTNPCSTAPLLEPGTMGNLAPLMAVCHQLCMGLERNCHLEDFEDSTRRHHPSGSMSHTFWCGYNRVPSSLSGTFLDNKLDFLIPGVSAWHVLEIPAVGFASPSYAHPPLVCFTGNNGC